MFKQPLEPVSYEEADELITKLVRRTREHPQLIRGAGVRATQAIKELSYAYEQMGGTLNLLCIEKAAALALPGRVVPRETVGKNIVLIIQEIIAEILYGITSFEYGDPFKRRTKKPSSSMDPSEGLIEELIDFQDHQFGGSTRLKNLHADYVRQKKAGKDITPDKLDYAKLGEMLSDLEAKGLVCCDNVGDGYRLQGEAVLHLTKKIMDKGVSKPGISSRKDRVIEKSCLRKYIKGDIYRDISPRHTIKRLVRKGKTIEEINIGDIQCFERVPVARRDIAICIDVSESVKQKGKLRYARIAAVGIAKEAIRSGDRVGVVIF